MRSLLERDRDRVWHPYTQSGFGIDPLPVVRAEGSSLFLEDGRRIIDGISSWWCCVHGHGHRRLAQVAAEQFATLDHVLFAGVTHEPAVALAERLCAAYPHSFSRVFFSDNGSTAVEVALKLAIQLGRNRGERRSKIIALSGAYHGDTFGAMAVGARSIFSSAFEELLFSVEYLSPHGGAAEFERCEELARRGDVACFIFEPSVQGAGGMRFVEPAVLDRYCGTFQQSGVVCIADEVMTGFGRTGPLFAASELGVAPDLVCLSKGLTSGTLPLAVTMCREEIFREFISDDHSRTFFHGHTFTANPIACAVALASLELVESAECGKLRARINQAHTEFAECLRERARVADVRVRGTILAFDIETREAGGYVSPIAQQARQFFIDRGVLLRPLGNVVYCMPPYCVTDEELGVIYSALEEFVVCLGQ
jgi:adenosylmethionine---8-amino-7-oxononanoate aminotransferase